MVMNEQIEINTLEDWYSEAKCKYALHDMPWCIYSALSPLQFIFQLAPRDNVYTWYQMVISLAWSCSCACRLVKTEGICSCACFLQCHNFANQSICVIKMYSVQSQNNLAAKTLNAQTCIIWKLLQNHHIYIWLNKSNFRWSYINVVF